MQTQGGSYGFISMDGDAVAPLSDYSSVNSAFSQAGLWENFNSARIVETASSSHTAALSFFATPGTSSASFNGGGLQGVYFPRDSAQASQTFACEYSQSISVGTTVMTVCSVTIVLPYRAAVFAQFTSTVVAPSGSNWMLGSIAFDGDAASAVQSAQSTDPNLLALGPAHTYTQVFKTFGQGRSIILNAGTHDVSVIVRASIPSGTMSTVGMDGFWVPN